MLFRLNCVIQFQVIIPSNHMPSKMRDEITYPFPNFKVLGMDTLFHPWPYGRWNYLSMLRFELIHVSKRPMISHPLMTETWRLSHIGYILNRIINSNLAKSRLLINHCSVFESFWNFAHSTAVSLPCFVQNFKTIWLHKWIFRTNEIARDLIVGMWRSYGISLLWVQVRPKFFCHCCAIHSSVSHWSIHNATSQ